MSLSNQQIRHLRGLAHSLKVIVSLGAKGLTDSVLDEIDNALSRHELLKIRVNVGDREERDAIIEQIIERTDAELIQRIGHIATLFRQNPDKPRIDPGKR
ncbi:ribosome assembly RNA-binding protein YhbY [Sulfuriflexus sp.]|uniref:ribosome assembly RNA-binding protein YhbY n=1 Tax=Sulfuriflexus sp. TaxID=2015443 RepID=UPI0028CCD8D1|nr:ribosome assembly RNA-binding protein YhbY [Sulfuriflexus sp.]MDT8403077.1 ribosome assembly RNA-binding protein YhbY [Sulfuriflexus sp.]